MESWGVIKETQCIHAKGMIVLATMRAWVNTCPLKGVREGRGVSPGGVEEVDMAHDELPDVNEVGHGVALLHEHLLGVAHPDWVLGVAGRQPPHKCWC